VGKRASVSPQPALPCVYLSWRNCQCRFQAYRTFQFGERRLRLLWPIGGSTVRCSCKW
jgi:hypothetical protein